MTDELLVISAGVHGRLAGILRYALEGVRHAVTTPETLAPAALAGRRIVFAVSLGPLGLDESFCRLLRLLRGGGNLLQGCTGVALIDGEGELYTKQAAHMLVMAANEAGCMFPGKPLVEGTGSLHNLDVLSRRMALPPMEVYRRIARSLVEQLLAFQPPRFSRPRFLMLHASDRKTSNTLALVPGSSSCCPTGATLKSCPCATALSTTAGAAPTRSAPTMPSRTPVFTAGALWTMSTRR